MAAAKEFNVGRDTLVEFLEGKGFNKDDLNGNVKLSEPMYRALQHQFSDDKVAKDKADRIEIPKGVQGEKKKKDDAAKAVTQVHAEPVAEPAREEQPMSQTPVVEVKEEPKVIVPEKPKETAPVAAPVAEHQPVVQPEVTGRASGTYT